MNRLSPLAIFLAAAMLADVAQATPYPGGVWEPGPAKYGSVVTNEVSITMDDGVILRANIGFPTELSTGKRSAEKFPVIIEFTPYVFAHPDPYFNEHGYIYAVVRPRGTCNSGGEVEMFTPRDGLDGKAIVNWAAHQLTESDGRIAMVGASYPGVLALTTAAQLGPNSPVKAIAATATGLNQVNRESFMVDGLLTSGFWAYTSFGAQSWGNSPAAIRFVDRFKNDVQTGGDAAYDRTFWHDRQPLRWAKNIGDTGIPILMWAGWQDIVEDGTVRLYAALQNNYAKKPLFGPMVPQQPVTAKYQIILGNWGHASGIHSAFILEWLDTWVKGVDTKIAGTQKPMHLYEPGRECWINLAGYPSVENYITWHLDDQNKLSLNKVKNNGHSTLVWGDPAKPESVLSFTTPPLAAGATLAGPMSATIYARSSNSNLELIAKLYDVAPDGKATLVTKGAMLGSQRELDKEKSWTDHHGIITWPWPKLERDNYLEPGKVYRFDLALFPRQWAINPDHRLRLDLTTQSPAGVNGLSTDISNLNEPQGKTIPGATYDIMYGKKWPSTLNLPQLAWKVFPEVRAAVPPPTSAQRNPMGSDFVLPLDWDEDR